MKVFKDKDHICNAPDILITNDTIISNNLVYIITSKTWDDDEKELYCKVEEVKEESTSISDILKELYKTDHFETSGSNTNQINENPRTIILLTLAGLVIEPEYFGKNHKHYMTNIIVKWNDKRVAWDDIFDDNPPIHVNDIATIKLTATKILTGLKINKNLWPNLEL
ncbi:hypothetical protein CCP1ISM_1480002 [Azospirillaceae bacterium]